MNKTFFWQIRYRCSAKGFSLIELMIVVAIIAVLAAIAYPSYTRQVIKTRRAAATACVSQYANYMERYYTTNMRYDTSAATPTVVNTLPALDCASPAQTGNYYSYTFGTPTASAYTISATPNPNGPQAADTQCGALALNQTGTRTAATGSTTCW